MAEVDFVPHKNKHRDDSLFRSGTKLPEAREDAHAHVWACRAPRTKE